jgi:hypothetical protein
MQNQLHTKNKYGRVSWIYSKTQDINVLNNKRDKLWGI